jgi:spore coat protein A
MLAANGGLAYDDRSHSGLWGDIILVNGRPWPVMKVQRRVYRFRVLNASISRSIRPTLSTGDPMYMVATDGGLMPTSRAVTSWRHGGAERYEVLIDFSKYPAGKRIELRNLSNSNNIDYDFTSKIMAFDVTDEPVDTSDPTWRTIPGALADSPAMSLTATQAVATRTLRVERTNSLWTLNGTTWDDVVASGYRKVLANPKLDDVEIWQIENKSGGWFHPLHIHLVDFQILSRNGKAPFDHERGPKDVVYVGENETVRLLMRFEHQRGRYMVHCHNLPHEDHDMMGQFSVGLSATEVDVNDPITADPCVADDEPADG